MAIGDCGHNCRSGEAPNRQCCHIGVGTRAGKGKAPHSTVCLQWNQGVCVYPYCKFRHVCVRCGGDHRTGCEMLDGRGLYIYMYMYMEHLLEFNRRVPLETSALPDGISMICRVLIAWFR